MPACAAVCANPEMAFIKVARLASPVSELWAAACASSRCKVRASVKSWNTMTDPLNSPRSLRIGETTSRMLQREPSLFSSTARLLCSTRCLRPETIATEAILSPLSSSTGA